MRTTLSLMRRSKAAVDRWLGWALAALMAVAVINVLWQVFTRFVLDHPSSYTEELARYLLVWIALLGAAYAVGSRMHLAIDLLPGHLSGRSRSTLEVAINGCVFLFALLVLVLGGGRLVEITLRLNETSPAFGLRVGYVYTALPAAGLLMMFYAAVDSVKRLSAPGPREPREVDAAVAARTQHADD